MAESTNPGIIHEYTYRLRLLDGPTREFRLRLDPDTLALELDLPAEPAPWTRLEHCRCANCPLLPAEHPHCPVARNLEPVIEAFREAFSFSQAEVEIETLARLCSQKTTLQVGLGSLVGLVMASSGCPHLDKLRPMLVNHLPFSLLRETVYRTISMYLVAQYFRSRRGLHPDWELAGLRDLLADIHQVNVGFVARLRSLGVKDAGLNALTRLGCFADTTSFMVEGDILGDLEKYFAAYLAG